MRKMFLFRKIAVSLSLFLLSTGTFFAMGDNPSVKIQSTGVVQQSKTVTCIVKDHLGPVIGASVIVDNSTNGSVTDVDGRVTINNVPEGATLVISFVGYQTQRIKVGAQSSIEVTLVEDAKILEEVVVVGYGTQAKKDITGSVSVVSADVLAETPVATFAEALQGKASGVHILSSGAPGADTTIRIRGVGSLNNSGPLIIVDGVSDVDINSVNPNDIESFQVLKDAAATAIYGAKAANGVIIVTTKQGSKEEKVSITYDGYLGWATMANDGFDLLNAWEAMEFQATGMVNNRDIRGVQGQTHPQFGSLNAQDQLTMPYAIKPSGMSKDQIVNKYGSVDAWVSSYKPNGSDSWARSAYYQMLEDGYSEAEARKGSDWYDMITQTGFINSHQLSLIGGSKKASYTVGLGYEDREGTIKGSGFERFSFRANTTFNPTKYFSIGQNTNASLMEFSGERGGQGDSHAFAKVYQAQPWVPVYNVGGDFAGSQATEGGREQTAIHQISRSENNWNRRFFAQNALFAEITPLEGFRVRTQFSTRLGGRWNREFWSKDIFANKEGQSYNHYAEGAAYWLDWQWTNIAEYKTTIKEHHNIQALVGLEAMKNGLGREIWGKRKNYIFENDLNTWTLNNGDAGTVENSGTPQSTITTLGYFGRLDYSYQGKYLLTATVRRDGVSRFAKNNRWGTFPSVSVGWRMSDELFMESSRTWLDDLKFRIGYGTTGNAQVGRSINYAFLYGTGTGYGYDFAGTDSGQYTGYVVTDLGDPNAKWETTKMLNVGLDGTLLKNRLTFNADYYIKKTSDLLVPANWSALAGNASKPQINIGDMENKGFDFSIGWRDKAGDFGYNITANISSYKNKVTKLGSSNLFEGDRLKNTSITTVGQPIGQFYGYQVEGIYKSVDDVMNNKDKNGNTILPFAVANAKSLVAEDWVGRYKFKDVDGDGKIDADDRTIIGNPHPDFTGGLNLSLTYKGFDLGTYLYFSVGNDIMKAYQYFTHYGALQSNYSKDRRDNSWHPTDNPDGKYPLWATLNGDGSEATAESHSMYIEDGSYLRMQTLTLGYTLPKKLTEKVSLSRVRFYGQLTNVFTITGYDGLDPEVLSTNDKRMGYDYGSYGMPRSYILGVNLSF